jgi:hyperosmotically inducible periplasmic protein
MRMTSIATSLLLAGVPVSPVAVAQDADADRAHPKAFVHDSVITTKIKSKLAAQHLASLAHIHVDTDQNGVVWLSGSAHNQEAVDQAVSIARDTEGVKDIKSTVKIRHDD